MNLKKIGKLFTSKFVGNGPSSFKKRIYWAAVSRRLGNTALDNFRFACKYCVIYSCEVAKCASSKLHHTVQ